MPIILLTRSYDENAEFMRRMSNEHHFSFINCPLLEYQDSDFDYSLIGGYTDIIISSKYVAKKLPLANAQKNIWVVGKKSAQILSAKNYNIKYIADNFPQLIQKLPKNLHQNMVYLSGKQITKKPPKTIKHLIVYQVKYTNSVTQAQLQQIEQGVDYVLLYSYNTAKTFLKVIKKHDLLKFVENLTIIAISLKVAEILKPYFRVIYCEEGQHQQMKGLLINDQRDQNSK